MWVSSGKAKQGLAFDVMKDAEYKYKLALRDATRSYENRFSDHLYDHLLAMTKFWKVWSAKTCKNVTSVKCVRSYPINHDKLFAKLERGAPQCFINVLAFQLAQ